MANTISKFDKQKYKLLISYKEGKIFLWCLRCFKLRLKEYVYKPGTFNNCPNFNTSFLIHAVCKGVSPEIFHENKGILRVFQVFDRVYNVAAGNVTLNTLSST